MSSLFLINELMVKYSAKIIIPKTFSHESLLAQIVYIKGDICHINPAGKSI